MVKQFHGEIETGFNGFGFKTLSVSFSEPLKPVSTLKPGTGFNGFGFKTFLSVSFTEPLKPVSTLKPVNRFQWFQNH